jgi:Tol biopolymer transport system component
VGEQGTRAAQVATAPAGPSAVEGHRPTGGRPVYTLDPERHTQPWQRLTTDGVRSVDPEWSPDGKRIAYTRGDYPNADIWVLNADGSGAYRLTKGSAHDMDAAWSREGAWISYVQGPYGEPQLRAIRVDGTGDHAIGPSGRSLGHPNWS